MPSVRKNEKRSHYLSRAIPEMIKEGLNQRAAVGKAEGMFNSKWHAKKKKITMSKSDAVKEHRHLVKVLKSGKGLKSEAKKQGAELKEYLKKKGYKWKKRNR